MTKDILDLAKPIRDASIAETERMLAVGNPVAATIADGHRLAAHLVSVCIADSAERTKTLEEIMISYNLHEMFAIAIGQLIGYAASSFRPIVNGQPITPVMSGSRLMQMVAACALEQLLHVENGTLDFNLQFVRGEDGQIEVEKFDFAKMMKGNT